jgi:uncharacterized protein (DUF58 family)
VLAVLALIATAINYGNNLVFALAFLLLAIWGNSAWECWRNLSGLVWQAAPTPPAFAGDPLFVSGVLRDPDDRAHRGIRLCDTRHQRVGAPADLAGPTQGDDVLLTLECPPLPRGRHALAHLALLASDPPGFWRRRRPLPPVSALIYPRPEGDLPLPAPCPHPAHARDESDDFQSVRPYAAGDSPRRVNWRVYSRNETLAVNVFSGSEGGQTLLLSWEACAGEPEARLSQLCRWLLEAERQGQEYALRLPGDAPGMTRTSRGRAHLESCLTRLALFERSSS